MSCALSSKENQHCRVNKISTSPTGAASPVVTLMGREMHLNTGAPGEDPRGSCCLSLTFLLLDSVRQNHVEWLPPGGRSIWTHWTSAVRPLRSSDDAPKSADARLRISRSRGYAPGGSRELVVPVLDGAIKKAV